MGKVGTSTVGFITLTALIWGGWVIGSQSPEGQEVLARAYKDFKDTKAQKYNQEFFATDALRVFVCGEGGLLESSSKPCLAIAAGGSLYIIDAGSGAAAALERVGMPLDRLKTVLLTGADTVRSGDLDELWALSSAQRMNASLPVYGPVESHRLVFGLNESLGLAKDGSDGGLQAWAPAPEPGQPVVVHKDENLEILAYTTEQDAFSGRVGYVFNYRGRILTVAPNGSAAWAAAAPGNTDVLLQSSFDNAFTELHSPDTNHPMASLQQFAQAAADAETGTLVFANAGDNPIVSEMSKRIAQDAGVDNVITGANGVMIELPLDNRDVNVRRL